MSEAEKMPRHVAVIMDGNGRWAEQHKVSRLQGHNRGMLTMKEIIKKADVMGIRHLTVYAFSTENWKRSQEEVGGIFNLLVKCVGSELAELDQNNVKVHMAALEAAIGRICADIAAQLLDARAHRLKALDVLVDGAHAEVAAAGHGDARVAEAAKFGADEIVGSADAAHKIDGCRSVAHVRAVDLERVPAEAADVRAHIS